MSWRGSFCTEYIYCDCCFQAAKAVLLGRDKDLASVTLPSWVKGESELPIIAGKVGGSYPGQEVDSVRELADKLSETVCHPVKIVVIPESGDTVDVIVNPK